jgi:succinoglycan biosynthesis transport protein ExoP
MIMLGKPLDEQGSADGSRALVPAASGAPAIPHRRDPYASLTPRGPDVEQRFEMRALLHGYLRMLFKRKWLILAIVVASVVVGAVRTLMITPLYTSVVRLQIDRNSVKVVEGGTTSPMDSGDSDFLRTQYELLQSRAMAERVAGALRLSDDQSFLNPREFSILSFARSLVSRAPSSDTTDVVRNRAVTERAAAGIILANRAVRPLTGSRLVDVIYSDPSPQRAQAIAAAYAEAFIASNLDKRFQANSYAKTFLEDQIKQLKLRLEDSERVLLDFAEREQIVIVSEKSSNAENNLAAANAALGTIISERIKSEQSWNQVASAKPDAINLPQLLTNSVIDGIRGRRNLLETEYREKLETYKPSYPSMVQIRNKMNELDRQLAAEVSTLKGSYKAAFENALSQESEIKKRIDTLKEEVLDLQKRSIQYNILKREVDTNRQLYDGLLQRFKEVDIAGGVGTNNVFVVDKAEVAGAPSSPDLSRALMLSLMIGLGIGCALAYGLERMDDRLHDPGEVERLTCLPALGIIPRISNPETIDGEMSDPSSAISEAYRSLCTALQFSGESGLPRSLLVTSAGPSEGKSYTSVAIAKHFATLGMKVLLIDADLRDPSLHKKLNLDNSVGLSTYLTGACRPPEALQATPIANLAFMSSGPLPTNAADLLGGARLHSLIFAGLEIFDLILFDGPPVMGLADAPIVSNATAGTIFVVGAGQAKTSMVARAVRRMHSVRGALLGTVITKFDAMTANYGYGYGNGYGYGYGYGKTADPFSYGQKALPASEDGRTKA